MAISAGYLAVVSKGGTPTSIGAGAAMTSLGGNAYQYTLAARRVIDPSVTPTFRDNGVAILAGDILSMDYLFGIVTFTGAKTGPITANAGNYIPVAAVAGANQYQLSCKADLQDDTTFDSAQGNGGYRTKIGCLLDVSLNIGRIDDNSGDFFDLIQARTRMLIELRPAGASTVICRGWFALSSEDHEGEISALEMNSLVLELAGSGGANLANFSFGAA